MTRQWTIEELDRVHPLRDGWSWDLWDDGATPVACHVDGRWMAVGRLSGRLCSTSAYGECPPDSDVALAVLLASKGLDSREAMAAALDSMASEAGRRSILAGGWEDPGPGEEHVNEDSEAESLYAGMADGFAAAARMLRRGTVQP